MSTVTESLQRAMEHHEAGRLEQAEALYREIIRVDPGHGDALHLLGVAAHQKSDHHRGAEYIRRSIAQGGATALSYSNLGVCYRGLGRLEEAVVAFREAVRLDPAFVGARYNLAMALEAAGSPEEAVAQYREVLRLEPGFVQALNNLGSLLSLMNRHIEAIEWLQAAVSRAPESAEFRYNLGNTFSRCGRQEEAIVEYREALRLNPRLPEAFNNLATALHTLGRHEEALEELKHALELRPDYAEALVNQITVEQALQDAAQSSGALDPELLTGMPQHASPAEWCKKGEELAENERPEQAVVCFQRALEQDSNCAAAYFGLGYNALLRGEHEEAATYYEQGLLLDDSNAAAWNNLGSSYTALDKLDDARACYESALQIDAANAKAHFNLGNVHKDLGELSEALACYRRALYIAPNLAEAHINLGVVLAGLGRLREASESHGRAVELRPHSAEAHYHRALTWLLMGEMAKGWDEYEWRWKYDLKPREFSCPPWDGRSLRGKRILVHGEQGIGDEIMFASCIPDVVAAAEHCLIECDPRLVPLFTRSFPLAEVVGRPVSKQAIEAHGCDVHLPAGSLPRHLRRSLDAFPSMVRYLAASSVQRRIWRERLDGLGKGLKVGIAWRGGKASMRRRRSTTLEQWNPIFAVPGVHFVNLQYGEIEEELRKFQQSSSVTIHHFKDVDPLKELEGTAAQIAELDLVISVDSATVHLAGALGTPVWTLLPAAPSWRWMLGRTDSVWYSSMQLIRQPEPGQWKPVFEAAAAHLRLLTTSMLSKSLTSASRGDIEQTDRHGGVSANGDGGPSLDTSRLSQRVLATEGAREEADPQAEEERVKYRHVWQFDEYRNYSPGASAIEQVGLVDALRKQGVRTILDAGCGTGKLMWRLMHEYPGEFEVHGFDIADTCLDECFASIKDQVLTVGCLWNSNDFHKVYDAVICTDVMEHIPTERVPAVLENLRRSTRRFAYFSISVVPDAFGPQLVGQRLHLTIQKPNWWFARLALAGFQIAGHAVARAGNGVETQLHVFATV